MIGYAGGVGSGRMMGRRAMGAGMMNRRTGRRMMNPNMGRQYMGRQYMGRQNMGRQNMGRQNMGRQNMGNGNRGMMMRRSRRRMPSRNGRMGMGIAGMGIDAGAYMMHRRFNQGRPSQPSAPKIHNKVINNAKHTGSWGGSCRCPNGQLYWVGDNDNWCRSLSCENGLSGTCHHKKGKWSRRKVVCGGHNKFHNIRNRLINKARKVGGWGGTCTCPNGALYWVGDNNNGCKSLACIHGKSGKCNRRSNKKWSHRKVICGMHRHHRDNQNRRQRIKKAVIFFGN